MSTYVETIPYPLPANYNSGTWTLQMVGPQGQTSVATVVLGGMQLPSGEIGLDIVQYAVLGVSVT